MYLYLCVHVNIYIYKYVYIYIYNASSVLSHGVSRPQPLLSNAITPTASIRAVNTSATTLERRPGTERARTVFFFFFFCN